MSTCAWVGDNPAYIDYHDTEWGVPDFDSRSLFEQLTLEGFQAGLSWLTILKKREGFRDAFAGLEPRKIAHWGDTEVETLLQNAGIVRHRGKIEATLGNARAWCEIEDRAGFSASLWDFVDGVPIQNQWTRLQDVPAETDLSRQISKHLKSEGFRFVGPTTVYAFMQAAGMVNDHTTDCARHSAVAGMAPT